MDEEGEVRLDVLLAETLPDLGVLLGQLGFAVELIDLQLQPHQNNRVLETHIPGDHQLAALLVLHLRVHHRNRVLLEQIRVFLIGISQVGLDCSQV